MIRIDRLLIEAARRPHGMLERALGYRFKDPSLLSLALTHKSAGQTNNERLEFIGDRKLNSAIADELYRRFPDESEGKLAKRINMLVQKSTCAAVARSIGLAQFLTLSDSERRTGGSNKDTILCDAIEAVIGAIFFDSGHNYKTTQKVVVKLWDRFISSAPTHEMRDYKTELQEMVQGRSRHRPVYVVVQQTGLEHSPHFTVRCTLGTFRTTGQGSTRKLAEQAAAAEMIKHLRGGHRA